MGDPRRIRKKYARPRHPWEGDRIEDERRLIRDYGLNNKKEIWKMDSLLTSFKDQVKRLNAVNTDQAIKEKEQLMDRLVNLGIIEKGTPMVDVLRLGIDSIMERRLQTIVFKKGLARTPKQARQFVVHEHITVDGKKVTVPSYLVRVGQDVAFSAGSVYKDEMHPERVEKKPAKDKIEKKEKKEDSEEEIAYKEEEILDEEEKVMKKKKDEKTQVEASEKKEESDADTGDAEAKEAEE